MGLLSRGMRNRNPLNIRHGLSHWIGRARDQTDPSFVVFQNLAFGYRAAWKLMETYRLRLMEQGKPYNIHNIISRWAPSNENDTQSYIKQVVKLSGLPEFQLLTPPGIKGDQLKKVIEAMTCVENGITMEQVPTIEIVEGYKLAFPRGWIETSPKAPE